MSKTAHEIDLITNANRYTMGKPLIDRIIRLIDSKNNLSSEDKLILAMNYAHSVTKSKMRGSK